MASLMTLMISSVQDIVSCTVVSYSQRLVLVTDKVEEQIESLSELAPLHNPANLSVHSENYYQTFLM